GTYTQSYRINARGARARSGGFLLQVVKAVDDSCAQTADSRRAFERYVLKYADLARIRDAKNPRTGRPCVSSCRVSGIHTAPADVPPLARTPITERSEPTRDTARVHIGVSNVARRTK